MAAAPLGGAGNVRAPIHPDLTYEAYFEVFSSWIYNGDIYGSTPSAYRPEVHDSLIKEFKDTKHNIDEEVKVHKKYLKHFFAGDHTIGRGSDWALKKYIDWLTSVSMLNRVGREGGSDESWISYAIKKSRPFIQAYLDDEIIDRTND